MRNNFCRILTVLGLVAVGNLDGEVAWAQSWSFPLGGQRGTTVAVEIGGFGDLKEAIFACDHLKGKTRQVGEQAFVDVEVGAEAPLGYHKYWIVKAGTVSRPLSFLVHAEPTLPEPDTPHGEASQALPIQIPSVVEGRLSEKEEADYYAFEAPAGVELLFELNTASGLETTAPRFFNDPVLSVHDPSGSWFDRHQPAEVVCADASEILYFPIEVQVPQVNDLPRLTHRFETGGWRVVKVGSKTDQGGPGIAYQLRIAPVDRSGPWGKVAWTPRRLIHPDPVEWRERDFARPIESDWIQKLVARAVLKPSKGEAGEEHAAFDPNSPEMMSLHRAQEQEPNDQAEKATELKLCSIMEGVIEHPRDVDYFQFSAKAGQELVFEIRTPDTAPPYFSPKLTVTDAAGRKLFDNFYRFIGGDGDDWGKSLEPKVVYTVEADGEYHLQVRDLTTRYGRPDFTYQLLIRPRIPHVGYVAAKNLYGGGTEHKIANTMLPVGGTFKLKIILEQEEGFEGDIAIDFENLPEGVAAYALSADLPYIASQPGQVFEQRATDIQERYRPVRDLEFIMLRASTDAPRTESPHFVRILTIPIVDGKAGEPIAVHELPVMVL